MSRTKVEVDIFYNLSICLLVQNKSHGNTAIGGDLALHTVELTRCKLSHASVIRVIHEVVYKRRSLGVKVIIIISGNQEHARMGSRPAAVQVSRPVGQPKAGEASAGVSSTKSPSLEQPPWKGW